MTARRIRPLSVPTLTLHGNGTLDDGQHQFLYDRAITTFFDLQGGLRSDIDSHPTRNWAAFGIQGLAPYFFDLEVTDEITSLVV